MSLPLTNPNFIIFAFSGVVISLWLLKVFRRAFFTPLRAIPGPWYARFTHLWLKVHILKGRRMHYIHSLHVKYGPVVRVSPWEIDFADPVAVKEIHRINSGFLKDPWYQSFRTGDSHDVFSVIDPKLHAQKRKLFAPLFSQSALMNNWYSIVVDMVTLTIEKMKQEASVDGETDIFKWWTFMAADVTSRLSFGEEFGMLELGKKTSHMQLIETATKTGLIDSEMPLVCKILRKLPDSKLRRFLNASLEVQSLAETIMQRTKSTVGATNLFSRMVAENEKNSEALTDYEVAFEASGLIVAGSGTTAVSLTYLVWATLSNPRIQERLEAEVSELGKEFTTKDLQDLPYLSAVIEETLRVYSAAPGALPRSVPEGGARLAGYFIPGGTTVSTQAYSIHRDATVYPDPEKFTPERFIGPDGTFRPAQSMYMPFGGGSRTCLGVHLARIELQHGAALFFRELKGARLSPRTTPKSMDMVNHFLISPAAEECFITLGSR